MTLEDELKNLEALGLKESMEYYVQEIMKPNQSSTIKTVYQYEGMKQLDLIEKQTGQKYEQVRRILKHSIDNEK